MSACHLEAAVSALLAGMLVWLELVIAAAVLVSYLLYLRDQFRTYTMLRQGSWQRAKPELTIGEQSASLSHLGKVWEMQLPSVIYLSEFLLVLIFFPRLRRGRREQFIWRCGLAVYVAAGIDACGVICVSICLAA